jgi:hypothetical protein
LFWGAAGLTLMAVGMIKRHQIAEEAGYVE